MHSDNKGLFSEEGSFIFNQRISWKEKTKNNREWAEKCSNYVDNVYSPYGDKDRIDRIQMNYDLYNGNGEDAMRNYTVDDDVIMDEDLYGGFENVQHHPAMEQIAKAMVGEQQMRPLNPIAFDTSSYANNQRKRKKLELLQKYIQETIVAPIMQQAQMAIMQENNIQDPFSLNPEQQKELQQQVKQRTDVMTPKEIHNYMRKDYKGPSEIQAQRIVEFLKDYLDLKFVTDEGFKHGIISGEEVYRIGIRHNMPFVEHVDPLGFFHISRPNARFVEDGVAWKYEQYVMYNDIYAWHGDEIDSDPEIKKRLDSYARELNFGERKPGEPHPKLVAEVQANPQAAEQAPDQRSSEGQAYLRSLFTNNMGAVATKGGDIRYTHTAWKSLRKLYYVTRVNKQTGELDKFWVDESYETNKKLDKEIEEHWVPEVWETTKVGESDGVYFQKRPIPYQYKSLKNPFEIKGPYVGAIYSKLNNNTDATSPMDLAKPWQYKFNIQMAKIAETESRDIGKLLTVSFHAKPKDWSWKKWLLMGKHKGVLPLDLQKEGVTPMDAQAIKEVDLSTLDRLAGQLQYLEFIRNQISLSMSYNPSRLGMVGNEISVTNNQQNIMQSSYQTYDIYNIHNKVIENLLNSLVNVTRVAFKDNPPVANYVLDDMSIAELNIDWEMLWRSEIAIKVRNSSEDYENILQLKRLTQPMIQNGLISFPDLIRIQGAKSWSQIENVAENAMEEMRKRQAEEHQKQQELMAKQQEMQQQLMQMQQQFEMMKLQTELASEEKQAQIESQKFAIEKDINQNQINDDVERTMAEMVQDQKEMIHKHEQEMKKLEEEIRKNKAEEQLKERELGIKEKEAKARMEAAKNKSKSNNS